MSHGVPSSSPPSAARAVPLPLRLGLAGLVVLGLFLAWYFAPRRNELNRVYGQRKGQGADSVNGTSVLAEMIRRRGSRVSDIHRLSPRLDRCDVLYWFPDDFQPPSSEQREWLEEWLASGYGRTVVYVGRDYDAAVGYWDAVGPTAPAGQRPQIKREWARVKSQHDSQRQQMPAGRRSGWFMVERDRPPLRVQELSGPWAEGVDAQQANITLQGRLEPPQESENSYDEPVPETVETLLSAGEEPVALRLSSPRFGSGQVIVLGNGSFVLNYPLVNHEHRKLAARLIEETTPAGSEVAFLISGAGGPPINKSDPDAEKFAALPYPLSAILYHAAVLLVVACLAYSPIFGRPLELPPETLADFGKHLRALGKLLQKTRDSAYAWARVQHYREYARRDSGKSHVK